MGERKGHMKYRGTEIEVKLGDRVTYRHLFIGQSKGVVAYIPGVSEVNPRIIENQWIVRLTNGKGVFMCYSEDIKFAHKRVVFLTRGENDSEITATEQI